MVYQTLIVACVQGHGLSLVAHTILAQRRSLIVEQLFGVYNICIWLHTVVFELCAKKKKESKKKGRKKEKEDQGKKK